VKWVSVSPTVGVEIEISGSCFSLDTSVSAQPGVVVRGVL
jgi:hypothetical protein